MDDLVSRQAAIDAFYEMASDIDHLCTVGDYVHVLEMLPSVQPYTEAEIQKMQDLYQAEIDEAFELGREDAWSDIIHCGECKHVGTDATCCLVCCREGMGLRPYHVYQDDYCSYAERKEEKEEAGEVDE